MIERINQESRGKSIAQLIKELQTFEDQSSEVRISLDGGKTHYPVSIVGKLESKFAGIINDEKE